jgi:glycosyltransferase involved in cell wall biosynthesis
MSGPAFSIIIPCFNQGHFLKDCLNSILDQKTTDWEVWIVNDGSDDNTAELAHQFLEFNSKIHYLHQPNQGLSAARNSGMNQAKGDFLLFLDADDWLETDLLSKYLELLSSNFDFQLFRCGYGYWDHPDGYCFHRHEPSGKGEIFPEVLTQNIGPCHSILIQREFAQKLGGFDVKLKSCEDWDFWIRAGRAGAKIFSINEVLVAYRYVSYSMSRNPRVMYKSLSEVSRRVGKIDVRLPQSAPYKEPFSLNYSEIQKNHLLPLLGLLIHLQKTDEAISWYLEEKGMWNWEISQKEWTKISSYLNWKYFLSKKDYQTVLEEIRPNLDYFFRGLGYSKEDSILISRLVLSPQLKKRNHFRYGRLLGAVVNRLTIFN